MDAFVTLYGWILAAKTAVKHRGTAARASYAVGISATFCRPLATGLSFWARRHTEILAMRVFTKVDLDLADFNRNTFVELVWSFRQINPPPGFYLEGG